MMATQIPIEMTRIMMVSWFSLTRYLLKMMKKRKPNDSEKMLIVAVGGCFKASLTSLKTLL